MRSHVWFHVLLVDHCSGGADPPAFPSQSLEVGLVGAPFHHKDPGKTSAATKVASHSTAAIAAPDGHQVPTVAAPEGFPRLPHVVLVAPRAPQNVNAATYAAVKATSGVQQDGVAVREGEDPLVMDVGAHKAPPFPAWEHR